MAIRNPYSEYARRDDEDLYRREALIQGLNDEPAPPPMTARPRTPGRTPQETREMLDGPGARTMVEPDTPADVGNPYGDPPPVYTGPSSASTGARPRDTDYNPQRGFQLMDEYDDPYTRRMEGSPGVGASAAKGASIGSGAGPIGTGVGAAAGAIAALFSKNAPTAMTDFAIDDARQIISQAHKDAFGRDLTPQQLDEIVRGQGWEPGDRWMGQDSLAYVLDAFARNAATEQASRGPQTAAAPAAAAAPAGATPGATGGGLPFSGFDLNRAQDPSKSAKDAFASLAQAAPPLTDTSKAGAEAWFRQHIAPGMEAAGYRVFDVQGDKAWVGAREDPEGKTPVDFLINAGGSNPQIGWQPDGGGAGAFAGAGSGDMQGAYQNLLSMVGPDASKEQMEAAITAAFKDVPGFQGAYKESVNINGQWYDLVTGYGGPGASWGGLTPKNDHGGGGGGVVGTGAVSGVNLAPGVSLAPALGNSNVLQEIMAEIQRLQRGQPPRAAIVDQLGAGA